MRFSSMCWCVILVLIGLGLVGTADGWDDVIAGVFAILYGGGNIYIQGVVSQEIPSA